MLSFYSSIRQDSDSYRPPSTCFRRKIGFVKQPDTHEPAGTVGESLRFSALMRQGRQISLQEKSEHCERVLDILDMQPVADVIVGDPKHGLNAEQLKRLTIAVELASKPEYLLLLDEPTAGLDSLAAHDIIRLLRKILESGLAVLCVIDQPSTVIFGYFHALLLLQNGGRASYYGDVGPNCETLINYFERNSSVTLPDTRRPAEVC